MLRNVCVSLITMAALLAMIITCGAGGQENDSPTMEEFNELVDRVEELEGKSFTIYGIDGRPFSQGQDQKGLHFIMGTVKIDNYGTGEINLSDSVGVSNQDVSFRNSSSYVGIAIPDSDNMGEHRDKIFHVVPLTGKRAIATSGEVGDTATVTFILIGE